MSLKCTYQAQPPLLAPDAGETVSLHCHHQMMCPTQVLWTNRFQFQEVKHRVGTGEEGKDNKSGTTD